MAVTVSMKIGDVLRGEEAYDVLLESNPQLSLPDEGKEYIVITVQVSYEKGEAEELQMYENIASLPSANRHLDAEDGCPDSGRKNPYAHDLKHSEAGELLSTKKDSQRHGYGVKSIQRTVERYSGEVLIDGKNRVFCLTVIMNLQQTEMKEDQGNSRRHESEEKE